MAQLQQTWSDRWRPQTLDDLVINDDAKSMLAGFLAKKTIPNLMLYGRQGTGKTSLARIIPRELEATSLYINASAEKGIDIVRNKITEFSQSISINGVKILILDEADGLTPDAQAALRSIIEECSDDTRFIFTCNYLNKIIAPIQSRCTPLCIHFDLKDVIARCYNILVAEDVILDTNKEIRKQFIEIIKKNFPDIRNIINILEQCCISGKFEYREISFDSGAQNVVNMIFDSKFKLDNFKKCREYWLNNEGLFNSDYLLLERMIFDKFTDNPGLLRIIADYIYKTNVVIDKEVQFSALIIAICSYYED